MRTITQIAESVSEIAAGIRSSESARQRDLACAIEAVLKGAPVQSLMSPDRWLIIESVPTPWANMMAQQVFALR